MNCFCWIKSALIYLIEYMSIIADKRGGQAKPWRAGVEYKVGDVVKKGNAYYKCVLAHFSTGHNKPPNATYWSVTE